MVIYWHLLIFKISIVLLSVKFSTELLQPGLGCSFFLCGNSKHTWAVDLAPTYDTTRSRIYLRIFILFYGFYSCTTALDSTPAQPTTFAFRLPGHHGSRFLHRRASNEQQKWQIRHAGSLTWPPMEARMAWIRGK